jgi:hypothetical protein
MKGSSCGFFAYGHSGSGKTHTIIGYDYDKPDRLGLCLAAAQQLFKELHVLNETGVTDKLGIGFSLFEMRKNSAFDLLNNRIECHIREGYDGKTHIRGPTEILEGGKVRVRPIVKKSCWAFEEFKQQLISALGHRAVGSSSIHDQSSRTHAILEIEVINEKLVEARDVLIQRQSELVPVGKLADDISVEEQGRSVVRTEDGRYVPNPDYQINQERIDKAEADRAAFQAKVAGAEEAIDNLLKASGSKGLGGKMVFVDLAGAEYQQDKTSQPQLPKQTPQERQEGRQINTDLLALKEVMRAWSTNQARIPFRSSPLTMVLRDHFTSGEAGSHAMIVTVSPAKDQFAATLNSLKYGSLVGSGR